MTKTTKGEGNSRQIFTRTTPEVGAKLQRLADSYRVTVSDYLRWLIEDAVKGRYKPELPGR